MSSPLAPPGPSWVTVAHDTTLLQRRRGLRDDRLGLVGERERSFERLRYVVGDECSIEGHDGKVVLARLLAGARVEEVEHVGTNCDRETQEERVDNPTSAKERSAKALNRDTAKHSRVDHSDTTRDQILGR